MELSIENQSPSLPKRLGELDYLKAICIIGMICVHVYAYMVAGEYDSMRISADSFSGIMSGIIEIIGAVAPFFMICLGVGIVYSRRSNFSYLSKRALITLIIALCLAFFQILPAFIATAVTGLPIFEGHGGFLFIICNDILFFAALTFFFFALVKKFKLPNLAVLGIAVALLISTYFVPSNCFADTPVLQTLFGWIYWQNTGFSCFNFAGWLIFPVFGYLFGQLLKKYNDCREELYSKTVLIGLAAFICLVIGSLFAGIDLTSYFTFYDAQICQVNVLKAIWFISLFLIILPILYCLYKNISTTCVSRLFENFSKYILNIYCAQWVIIASIDSLIMCTFDLLPISYLAWFIITVVVIIASYFIAVEYRKIKAKIMVKKSSE